MIKRIYVAREASSSSDSMSAYYDRAAAVKEARSYYLHQTARERKLYTVTLEAYEIDVTDESQTAEAALFASYDDEPNPPAVEYIEIRSEAEVWAL